MHSKESKNIPTRQSNNGKCPIILLLLRRPTNSIC